MYVDQKFMMNGVHNMACLLEESASMIKKMTDYSRVPAPKIDVDKRKWIQKEIARIEENIKFLKEHAGWSE